jgi:hypothetical protein
MGSRKATPKKSAKVKVERGSSPEDVVTQGELLGVHTNPNYPEQHLEAYWFQDYVWIVPVVTSTGELKTTYPSRKFKKEYGR